MSPIVVSPQGWITARRADRQRRSGSQLRQAGQGAGRNPWRQHLLKDGANIYHTYSSYARGAEGLIGAFSFLDMVPKGRNEPDHIMQWVCLHDQYDTAQASGCCH
jgi:predicted dithiol-disulfide oxidoreductase (DUF899 family)